MNYCLMMFMGHICQVLTFHDLDKNLTLTGLLSSILLKKAPKNHNIVEKIWVQTTN